MSALITSRLATAAEPRTARLGASEVAAALGLSPWQTPFQVWARKCGLTESAADDSVQRRGRYLEPGVLAWLHDDTGADALLAGSTHDAPWVSASPTCARG